MRKKLISILIPAYNEENNIDRTYQAIVDEVGKLQASYDFEFIFIDDCSTDATFQKLQCLADSDKRLKVFRFSRNYGFQRAVHTAYVKCNGDAAIQMDCDLQDPVELIPQFIECWEQGNEVVHGVRRTRKEGYAITTARRFFYWLIDRISTDNLPRDAGDCRLVDRKLINILAQIEDTNIYGDIVKSGVWVG